MANAIALALLALWFSGHHGIAIVTTIVVGWYLANIKRDFRR